MDSNFVIALGWMTLGQLNDWIVGWEMDGGGPSEPRQTKSKITS